jgi:Toprim domain
MDVLKASALIDETSRLRGGRLSNTVTGADANRKSRALAIWADAHSLLGTPASTYLSNRGISLHGLPYSIGQALRWHPSCPWSEGGTRRGCLVALWTDAITGEPRAIHRRPIGAAGEKVDGWKALGPTKGCLIRLSPDETVTTSLVIGEGVETTLAAATRVQHRATLLTPAWASGDAGHLEELPALPGIESLTILVDHDENGRGQRAAAECARRWLAAGCEVTQLIPRIARKDFADPVGDRHG